MPIHKSREVMGNDTSSSLDTRLEAVSHPVRREVLYELRRAAQAGDTAVCVHALHGDSASDSREVALMHRHLPKLAEHGFVCVCPEGEHVERGPQFDDLLPLLDHLASSGAAADESGAVSQCD